MTETEKESSRRRSQRLQYLFDEVAMSKKVKLSGDDVLFGGELCQENSPVKAAATSIFIFLTFHALYLVLPGLLLIGPFFLLMTSYKVYALCGIVCYWSWVLSDPVHMRGGRPWPFFENLPFIRFILEWLPVRILRTKELDPTKKYVFACHPHGTLAYNRAAVGFSTNTLWNKAFPGISFRVLTARAAFYVPFIRELWLWSSCVDASRQVASKLLSNDNCSVFVYPGGEKEQIQTEYQQHRVFLSSRKGFVRLALVEGAELVPVYAFGETDLYHHSHFALPLRKYLVQKFGVRTSLFV